MTDNQEIMEPREETPAKKPAKKRSTAKKADAAKKKAEIRTVFFPRFI